MRRLLLPALSVLVAACSPQPAPDATAIPPRPVEVAAVRVSTECPPVVATATLGRRTELALGFRATGFVAALPYRPGDAFAAGAVLAELDTTDLDARLAQARSSLDNARRDLARAERLAVDDALAEDRVDDARTGVEQAEAAVRAAAFEVERARIVATDAGTVVERLAEPGELATPGRPVLRVALHDAWVARAGVSDRAAGRVRVGASATLNFGGSEVSGRVLEVAGGVTGVARTVEVVLELDREPAGARIGYIGSASIASTPGEPRAEVPVSALVAGDGAAASVFVLGGGETVRRVRVRVERLAGATAAVDGPLAAGDRVVTAGAEYLRDGDSVQPVSANR